MDIERHGLYAMVDAIGSVPSGALDRTRSDKIEQATTENNKRESDKVQALQTEVVEQAAERQATTVDRKEAARELQEERVRQSNESQDSRAKAIQERESLGNAQNADTLQALNERKGRNVDIRA